MQRFRHPRLFTLFSAAASLVILVAIAVAESAVRPPIARATSTCSVRSLKGDYLGSVAGVSRSTGPLALQVRATYHGDGTATASATLMTQTSGPTSSTDTATYTVKSDCTGTVTIVRSTGQTSHFNIVLLDNATQIDHMQTDPGFVVTGTLQKK